MFIYVYLLLRFRNNYDLIESNRQFDMAQQNLIVIPSFHKIFYGLTESHIVLWHGSTESHIV